MLSTIDGEIGHKNDAEVLVLLKLVLLGFLHSRLAKEGQYHTKVKNIVN